MIRAAGVLMMSPAGRVLLMQRSATGDNAGAWSCPGGKIEGEETPAQAAVREVFEETGYEIKADLGAPLMTRIADDVHFTTFLLRIPEEFVPTLNDEHLGSMWALPAEILGMASPVNAAPATLQ